MNGIISEGIKYKFVGCGVKADYQHFLPFPQYFFKSSILRVLRTLFVCIPVTGVNVPMHLFLALWIFFPRIDNTSSYYNWILLSTLSIISTVVMWESSRSLGKNIVGSTG